MSFRLLPRFTEELRRLGALRRGERLLVAASGGLDSTVLAHLLGALAGRWRLTVTLAYIHHGLRAEADGEALAVEAMAASLGFRFATRRIDLSPRRRPGESLQAAARALRYAALEELRAGAGATWILTAHHADDQAETVLARFLRGTGSAGLSAIRPRSGNVIRPLLFAERAALENYARAHGLMHCHDSSNESDAYTRNALRRHVLPAIRAYVNPGATAVLCRAADHHRELQEYLEEQRGAWEKGVLQASSGAVCLAVQPLIQYLDFQQRMVIQHAIELTMPGAATDRGVRRVQDLLRKQAGTHVTLEHSCIAERMADSIVIRTAAGCAQFCCAAALGATVAIAGGSFSSRRVAPGALRMTKDPASEYIDLAAAGEAWTLRSWKRGDAFHPLGATGRKKLSDFFIENKIPRHTKSAIPILERNGDIIWVCGMRLDRRFRVTGRSSAVALITFQTAERIP